MPRPSCKINTQTTVDLLTLIDKMAVAQSVLFLLLFAAINFGSTQPLPAPKWPHPFESPKIDDYDVLPFSGGLKPTFNWTELQGTFKSGKPYSAFIGILTGDPTYFSIKLPQQGEHECYTSFLTSL